MLIKNKKKIFLYLIPFLLSLILIIIIFIFLLFQKKNFINKNIIKTTSISMSRKVLCSSFLKESNINFSKNILFLGSSELNRFNAFHPNVLLNKYNRKYNLFLCGNSGTQSLFHSIFINFLNNKIKNKKIILIISPQWFIPEGTKQKYFEYYYSKLYIFNWLNKLNKISLSDIYLAKRLLNFKKIYNNKFLFKILNNIKKNKKINFFDKKYIKIKTMFLLKEDMFFNNIFLLFENYNRNINYFYKFLPKKYNKDKLKILANKIGKKETNNNKFNISNKFFNSKIKNKLYLLKNSQKKINYCFSKEFSDFQLILSYFKKQNADVLFLIPPINKKWAKFTGISINMFKNFSKKIIFQLKSQGFNNIIDFTYEIDNKYFLEDTIHLGWKGWLEIDEKIQEFLKFKYRNKIKLNNKYFFSKKWQILKF